MEFLTVAEELLEHAQAAAEYFDTHGYGVTAEHHEVGFPYTPTLQCRRQNTKLLVEVAGSFPHNRLREWNRYTRSCSSDTRIALVIPRETAKTIDDESQLRDLGVGLYLSNSSTLEEAIQPRDVSLNVELPELSSLPPAVRQILGSVYEQFERAQWRDGFRDACQALEAQAREYLKVGMRSGRILLVTKAGNTRKMKDNQVDKMTLGALGEAFDQIQTKNHSDKLIGEVITRINKDRIAVIHHKTKWTTEERLRKNVGRHMWSVVAALKELLGV
jgi:hypothetical protein